MNTKTVLVTRALAFLGLAFISGSVLAAPPGGPPGQTRNAVIVSPLAPSGAVAVEGEVAIVGQEIKIPFQEERPFTLLANGSQFENKTFTAPLGQRVVIESLSVLLASGAAPVNQVLRVSLSVMDGQSFPGTYMLITTPVGGLLAGSQKVLLYVDAGAEMRISVVRTDTSGLETYRVTYAGHLVDVP